MSGEQEANHLGRISEDMAVLKNDSADMKENIKKIYDVLNRLSVLEDNRGHTEDSITKLFELYGEMSKQQAAILSAFAVVQTKVDGQSKTHNTVISAIVSVITAIITLFAARHVK